MPSNTKKTIKIQKKDSNDLNHTFDSSLSNDMQENFNKFINSANTSIYSFTHNGSNNGYLTQKMLKNWTKNLNDTFENNMDLSQECLKCTTAVDLIDIQSKFFEYNFHNATKLYFDFVYDMQQLASQNIKNSSERFDKNQNRFRS